MWPDFFGTLDFHLAQQQKKKDNESNTCALLEDVVKNMHGVAMQEKFRYLWKRT